MFVSFNSLGQTSTVNVNVKKESSTSDYINAGAASRAAAAEAEKARAAKAAAMNESTTEIKIPLEVDLNSYTHIALVGVTYAYTATGQKVSGKSQYDNFSELFLNSPLIVINPYERDKKRAKKNNRFLREIKEPSWIYLYYETSIVGVDSHRTFVLRDYKNKIIFQGKYVNLDKADVVSPLVYF